MPMRACYALWVENKVLAVEGSLERVVEGVVDEAGDVLRVVPALDGGADPVPAVAGDGGRRWWRARLRENELLAGHGGVVLDGANELGGGGRFCADVQAGPLRADGHFARQLRSLVVLHAARVVGPLAVCLASHKQTR